MRELIKDIRAGKKFTLEELKANGVNIVQHRPTYGMRIYSIGVIVSKLRGARPPEFTLTNLTNILKPDEDRKLASSAAYVSRNGIGTKSLATIISTPTSTGYFKDLYNNFDNEYPTDTKQTTKGNNMLNVIKLVILDTDPALNIDSAVVHTQDSIVVRDVRNPLPELAARGLLDYKGILDKANAARAKTTDVKQTALMGREVYLTPIEWKDLDVRVVEVG